MCERRRLSLRVIFRFGCSIATSAERRATCQRAVVLLLARCLRRPSKLEGVPRPISHPGCRCLLDPYRHVHLKDGTRAKASAKATGEVKFSSTSYTIYVRLKSLNLSF